MKLTGILPAAFVVILFLAIAGSSNGVELENLTSSQIAKEIQSSTVNVSSYSFLFDSNTTMIFHDGNNSTQYQHLYQDQRSINLSAQSMSYSITATDIVDGSVLAVNTDRFCLVDGIAYDKTVNTITTPSDRLPYEEWISTYLLKDAVNNTTALIDASNERIRCHSQNCRVVGNTGELIDSWNRLRSQTMRLQGTEIIVSGVETIDGRECYVLNVVPQANASMQMIRAVQYSSKLVPISSEIDNLSYEEMANNTQLSWTVWVGKDDGIPVKDLLTTDLSFELKGFARPLVVDVMAERSIQYSDINQPITIDIPQDLKDIGDNKQTE